MLAGLGYAVPGTVLALALLSPLVAIDEGLNTVSRALTGAGVGLVVAGSGAAIVIAYVVRFLTIATGSAQAGLSRISTRVDDAARTLGKNPARWLGSSTFRSRVPRSAARRCSCSSIA